MREGPLAALFRKTEEEGVEGRQEPPAPKSESPAAYDRNCSDRSIASRRCSMASSFRPARLSQQARV